MADAEARMRSALRWFYAACIFIGVFGGGIAVGIGYFAFTLLFHVKPW